MLIEGNVNTSAIELYKEASDRGISDGSHRLGVIFLTGKGVDQSDQKALSFFEKAYSQGNDPSINCTELINNSKYNRKFHDILSFETDSYKMVMKNRYEFKIRNVFLDYWSDTTDYLEKTFFESNYVAFFNYLKSSYRTAGCLLLDHSIRDDCFWFYDSELSGLSQAMEPILLEAVEKFEMDTGKIISGFDYLSIVDNEDAVLREKKLFEFRHHCIDSMYGSNKNALAWHIKAQPEQYVQFMDDLKF